MPERIDRTSGDNLHYDLIRSRRKSLSLIVRTDGSLEIRCPLRFPRSRIDRFVQEKQAWISRKRRENLDIVNICPLSAAQRAQANRLLPDLIQAALSRYAGPRPVRITVRDQRSRWGSCSNRGHIAINSRCLSLPPDLQFYVIWHELCHLTQMNHSPAFWDLPAWLWSPVPVLASAGLWLMNWRGKITGFMRPPAVSQTTLPTRWHRQNQDPAASARFASM